MQYKKEAEKLANKILDEIIEEEGGSIFPIDPFKLLKNHDILFTFMDFDKLEGIIINDEDNVTVVGINRNRPWTRQRFTAAHEYCHYIKDINQKIDEVSRIDCLTDAKSPIEKFADEFASHLLVPSSKLKELCLKYQNDKGYVDFENVTRIAEFFGASFQCVLYRIAFELKMIEGDTSIEELVKRTKEYKPDKKRAKLIENNNDHLLLGNVINSLSYCMVDLNDNIGTKFMNNYIYYDNKLEGITQENVSYILADLSYNKENSKFYNPTDANIIMTLGNWRLQEYVLSTDEHVDIRKCRDLHRLLYSFTPYPEYSGIYRMENAMIQRGTIQPTNYTMIDEEIGRLASEFDDFFSHTKNMATSEYISKAVEFMYRFIVIHPFQDGNGRVSRAILNWMLKAKGIPPIYIDDKSRKAYYEALSDIDLKSNYEPLEMLIEKRIINTLIELHDYLFIEENTI